VILYRVDVLDRVFGQPRRFATGDTDLVELGVPLLGAFDRFAREHDPLAVGREGGRFVFAFAKAKEMAHAVQVAMETCNVSNGGTYSASGCALSSLQAIEPTIPASGVVVEPNVPTSG
jgi:hypothetical protein